MMLKRLLLFSITCLLFISCSDDPSTFTDEPPELPPVASMDADMSTLIGSNQAKSAATTHSADYYIEAVFHAGFLKRVIDNNLSMPKDLLEAAEDTVAQLNDNQQWEWNYQYTTNTNNFDVRLVAERIASSVINWSFFVTADHLGLENHLLFSGTTQDAGKEGTWMYNSLQDPENDQQLSEINWTIQDEQNVQLRLDVLSDRLVAAGSYIDFSFDEVQKTVAYYDAGEDTTTTIQWNVDTKAGYIVAPNINNGEKACWDEEQENINCSE